MERDPYFPGRRAIALPVKDALRGTRALFKRATRALVSSEPATNLPVEGRAARGWLDPQIGHLAFEIAQGLRLDPRQRLEVTSGLRHVTDTERAGAAFAKLVRQGLIFSLQRFDAETYLVSETLAAAAYWSGLRKLNEDDVTAVLAAHLYRSLIRHHIAAFAPGTPIGMEDHDLEVVKCATLATMIWLLIERPEPQENEDEILGLCADVAMSLKAEIEAVENDVPALARLMASYADVI